MPHLRSKVRSLTVVFRPTWTYEDEIREAVSERAYYAWWSLPEDPTDYQGNFDTSCEGNAGDSIEVYHPCYPGWTRKVNSMVRVLVLSTCLHYHIHVLSRATQTRKTFSRNSKTTSGRTLGSTGSTTKKRSA